MKPPKPKQPVYRVNEKERQLIETLRNNVLDAQRRYQHAVDFIATRESLPPGCTYANGVFTNNA